MFSLWTKQDEHGILKIINNKDGVSDMNRKGFTLAELLAVLSILAIIALIVFPKVGGVIDESEKKAFERSMDGIKRAVEVDYQDDSYRGNRVYKYENGKLTLISVDDVSKNQNIKVEGNMENGMGEIFVDQSGNVFFMVSTDEWCATKSSQFGDISIEEKNDNNCVFNNCPLISIMGKVFRSCELMTNDPDGNLRYVGANPNNYVLFNNELWRIIGEFDGQIKIIKNDYYTVDGRDTIAFDVNANTEDGYNIHWSTSSLNTEFNEVYLKHIKENSSDYSYIDTEHVWDLGTLSVFNSEYGIPYSQGTRSQYYIAERELLTIHDFPSTWTGAIGLMYPSDVGYATSSMHSECDTEFMINWNSNGYGCAETSWLNNFDKMQENDDWYGEWNMIKFADSSNYLYQLSLSGGVITGFWTLYSNDSDHLGARPVLFLKSDVRISGGEGSELNPYTLTQ